jgi:Arc/MetJ family transcription regulator
MKTTVDIPDEILGEAMRYTGATTKRAAVVTAMTDYVRRRRMAEVARHLGSCADLLTPAELERARADS